MRSLLLATAAMFVISCGGALAASTGAGSAGGGTSGGAGVGGGNAGMPANGISTPDTQSSSSSYGVTSNQTTPSTTGTGAVIAKPTSNPQAHSAAPGSQ